jgi:predicted metal-dependent hydrolase
MSKFDIIFLVIELDYILRRSDRRTLSIEIQKDGTILVRAPLFLPVMRIETFLTEKRDWIERKRAFVLSQNKSEEISSSQVQELRNRAKELILPRVRLWSEKTGLVYAGAKITSARGRFGSCSGKNSLSFSLYLALCPDELIDYVIVHELCHTKEHNHSRAFYALVEQYLPDWKARHLELKKISIPRLID